MNYQYTGKQPSGQKIKGKIEADSKKAALSQLEKKGFLIFELEETKPWNKDIQLFQKVKNKDFVIFLRQFSTLIHAGISVSDTTKTMEKQVKNDLLKSALKDIDKQLEQGIALSKAVKSYPKIFPSLLVNMIHAGEASGKLDEILEQMADYYEKAYRNKQKIVSALLYPSVVGIITILLSVFLLMFVVPQFVQMFNSIGEEVPAYTQFVLSLSEFLRDFWWIGLFFVVLIIALYNYLLKYRKFAYQIDIIKMRFPLFGVLVHKGALVRMTQTLSTLVNSSVSILQSIKITENVVENRVIEGILKEAGKSLENGESMTEPMKHHWAFPALITQMIQIGEKTGTLDHMLLKSAEFYEEEVEQLSTRMKSLIEPLMIVGLAVIVGGIIAAVVIPMFGMFEIM